MKKMWLVLLFVGLFALCFSWCEAWLKIMKNCFLSGTLKALTNVHTIRGRPTLKDVERQFRNGSFREPKKCHNNSKITPNKLKAQDNVKKKVRNTRMNSSELISTRARSNWQTNKYCFVRKDFIEDYSEEIVRQSGKIFQATWTPYLNLSRWHLMR